MILPQAVYNHSMIYLGFLVEDLPDPESLKRGFACTTSGSPPVLSPSTRLLTGQARLTPHFQYAHQIEDFGQCGSYSVGSRYNTGKSNGTKHGNLNGFWVLTGNN